MNESKDFRLDSFIIQQCDIQGRLFEYSLKNGVDSDDFIEKFMLSDTAKHLDLKYDRLQWAGEEYIFSNLSVEDGIEFKNTGKYFNKETLYWIGYIYRYWSYYTNESSSAIYEQADCNTMNKAYAGFHTLDARMAVDNLKELQNYKTEAAVQNMNNMLGLDEALGLE